MITIQSERDISIDIIRGIAIVIMLGANVVGYVTSCSLHPLWFDIYSSYAAPLFILLSGYMVAINITKKDRTLSYFLIRGGLLILTSAFIDVFIWWLLPFAAFDVLYVIGIGLPLVYILEKKSLWIKTGFIAVVLIITAIMQYTLEYMEFPIEIEFLSEDADYSGFTFFNVTKALFYDGWFPLFPWIVFPVLGSIFAHLRKNLKNNCAYLKVVLPGILLFIGGLVWLYFSYTNEVPFDELVKREPYGEIFYPATIPYIISSLGVVLLVFALADKTRNGILWRPVTVFGQTSLFNYILHSAIVAYIIIPLFGFEEEGLHPLYIGWIVYGAVVMVSYIISLLVNLMKKKVKSKNFFFNFYFGG